MTETLIMLDTETTGVEVKDGHRIIEIGAMKLINREITDEIYHQYIQPDRTVGDSFAVHEISDNFLKNKPHFADIVNQFISFVKGQTLVIHNATFDIGFINNEFKLAGIKDRIDDICSIIDSIGLSQKQRPGGNHSLDAICRRFNIDISSRVKHGALIDVKILAQAYLAITGGQINLFNDTIINKTNTNIKHIDATGNIKIIYANKAELALHNKYFDNL